MYNKEVYAQSTQKKSESKRQKKGEIAKWQPLRVYRRIYFNFNQAKHHILGINKQTIQLCGYMI